VECPNWNPWNVLTGMHRRKRQVSIAIWMDGTIKGATNKESVDNWYEYL